MQKYRFPKNALLCRVFADRVTYVFNLYTIQLAICLTVKESVLVILVHVLSPGAYQV